MNKTVKVVSILLITILLIASLSQVCLASDYTNLINNVDSQGKGQSTQISGLSKTAGNVLKALRNIAAIIAVLVITILGIKYMIGSTEERAEYKKSFIPLIVGIVVVVAAASIATALFGMAG